MDLFQAQVMANTRNGISHTTLVRRLRIRFPDLPVNKINRRLLGLEVCKRIKRDKGLWKWIGAGVTFRAQHFTLVYSLIPEPPVWIGSRVLAAKAGLEQSLVWRILKNLRNRGLAHRVSRGKWTRAVNSRRGPQQT